MASKYDPSEISDALEANRLSARTQAATSVGDNPDDAARAIKLGQATGLHPLTIYGDDTFEPRHKAQLASNIIDNNDALERYVHANPMSAKVSNDDWGALDEASKSIKAAGEDSVFGRFVSGFKEGFGDPQLGEWMYNHEPTRKFLEKYPGLAIWAAGGGGVVELPAKVFGGALHGAHGAIEQTLLNSGMEPSSAKKLAKDLTGVLEYKFIRPEVGAPGPLRVRAHDRILRDEIAKTVEDNLEAKPYIDAGKDPPYGLTKDIDAIKEEQSKTDAETLDAATKDFQKTATFERSPEMAAIFAGVHPETKIEIAADAIRKIYAEKEPTPEDGLLGRIPGFAEQWGVAKQTGTGVEITLKDWIQLDPKLQKELKDDVRAREGGVSKTEVEEAKEAKGIEVYHGSPHEFEAFDISKIGTGEGAQAYGHGLYFAEAQSVGETYRKPGYRQPGLSDAQYRAMDVLSENGGDRAKAIAQLESAASYLAEAGPASHGFPRLSPNEVADALKLLKEGYQPPQGTLYKARIHADKEHFLDWDKPLSEQPPRVQEAIKKISENKEVALRIKGLGDNPTMGQIYGAIGRGVTHRPIRGFGEVGEAADKAASKALLEAGIPGIKYLDQGSRQEGAGTRNFVLFDPSLVEVISRNGEALRSVRQAAGLDSKILKEIEAYHGSAANFKAFDPSKIGTGEGGGRLYGFYLSEDQFTAEGYRLAGQIGDPSMRARGLLERAGGDRAKAIADNAGHTEELKLLKDPNWNPEGTLYRVGVKASQADMLDLDKPLSQQPAIAEKLKGTKLEKLAKEFGERPTELYQELSFEFGGTKAASDALREAGVPGATYIGEGGFERNYVVFDTSLMKIKDKSGAGSKGEPPSAEPAKPAIFGPGALGLPEAHVQNLQDLADKRLRRDMARAQKIAEADEKRKQTEEWKNNAKVVRGEVETEFYKKPEVAATRLILDKNHFGQTVRKYTLDEATVTPEQRAALPDKLFQKTGKKLTPDALAELVGAQTGKSLLEDLAALHEGIGEQPHKAAFNDVIKAETERRMQERYGDLAENILKEAQKYAVNLTTHDLLHADTAAMAALAGSEMPYTKAAVRSWIKALAKDLPMSMIKANKYLQDAGRLGKKIEVALSNHKFVEAFKMSQGREHAALLAHEAIKIVEEREKVEAIAKRWRKPIKPEDPIAGEAGDMIHDVLVKVGFPVDRSVQQIQESMLGHDHKNLQDFVEKSQADGLAMPVPDFLFDTGFFKKTSDMTYGEFKQVKDGLDALIHYGKREKKRFIGEREKNVAEMKEEMIGGFSGFPTRTRGHMPKGFAKGMSLVRRLALLPLQTEAFMNRLDRGESGGAFTQYMMRDLVTSANQTEKSVRDYGKLVKALKDDKDLTELIPNTLIKNPLDGTFEEITRGNLRKIMVDMGNPENFKKFHEGWKVDPQALRDWVFEHATKEDLAYAQGWGKIFKQHWAESQRMQRRLNGVAADSIETPPVETPFGTVPGWYAPLVRHPVYEGEMNRANKIQEREGLYVRQFERTTTPDGHTRDRTSARYPISMDLDSLPGRLKTMIYDTNMREAVVNFNSFLKDKEWRAALTKHFGVEYRDMLDRYIKDVANYPIHNAEMNSGVQRILSTGRRNIISALIAYNIGTVLKHGPTAGVQSVRETGGRAFSQASGQLIKNPSMPEFLKGESEKTRQGYLEAMRDLSMDFNSSLREFVEKMSEEIQRRIRHYEETLFGGHIESTGGQGKFAKAQTKFIEWGAKAVALSDQASAYPTWLAQYRETLAKTGNHGDAVFMADRAVRRAHGSSIITNRPEAMRGGQVSQMFTGLYGFFNHMFNRSYEMMWKEKDSLKDSYDLFKAGEAKEGWTEAGRGGKEFFKDFMAYVIMPALIEELVQPLPAGKKEEEESLLAVGLKGIAHATSAQVPVVRDVVDSALRGQAPQAGMFGAASQAWNDLARDWGKLPTRDFEEHIFHIGDYLQHMTTAMGMVTAIGSRPVGNAAKYWINVYQGIEEAPEGPWEAATGTRFGTAKKHPRTLEEYGNKWLEKAGLH